MTPQDLKSTIGTGLLSFPVTDFDDQGDFRPATYAQRLEWLAPYGARLIPSNRPGKTPAMNKAATETLPPAAIE